MSSDDGTTKFILGLFMVLVLTITLITGIYVYMSYKNDPPNTVQTVNSSPTGAVSEIIGGVSDLLKEKARSHGSR